MRIIVSPAKKMVTDIDSLPHQNLPHFLQEAQQLTEHLKMLSYEEIKKLWKCNDKIATINYENLRAMNLKLNLTPAIFAYDGIQYKYIKPHVFETQQLEYIETHLRIISGLYGVLRPFDGVVPYRLEMQAKFEKERCHLLYDFWADKIAMQLCSESDIILNLASKEYSRCISPFLPKHIQFITCVFGEIVNGKLIEKGVHCKMARGEMIHFMAENAITKVTDIKKFNRLNYVYSKELSSEDRLVFINVMPKVKV